MSDPDASRKGQPLRPARRAPADADVPLCVDLDGTLLLGDVGIESALALVKRNPLHLFPMLLWLARGFAPFKREIARRIALDPESLPIDQRVLDWIITERKSRPCLLVTASDVLLAKPVAERLGCFDEVIATDQSTNLAAAAKARMLVQRFGEQGFDYVGNSASDLAVWPHARHAIVANASPRLLARAHKSANVSQVFPQLTPGMHKWAQALRLHQWVKNLLVFVPLLGAHLLGKPELAARAALAWLLFGLCTSGTYLINDLLDLDADRQHPRKRTRPLPSGRLNLESALRAIPALIGAALIGAWLLLPMKFLAWLAAYLILTLGYSLWLKRIIVLDAAVLALLFTIRIFAGGGATGVAVSSWLAALSLVIFLSLALMKRYTELRAAQAPTDTKLPGRGYHRASMRLVAILGAAASVAGLAILAGYIPSPTSHALYQHPTLLWLLWPLAAWWLARLWWLAKKGRMHDDPIMFAVRDPQSWLTAIIGLGILWSAV